MKPFILFSVFDSQPKIEILRCDNKLCSSCQAEKQVGNTHPKKNNMSTSKIFELLHMDLFGPTQYTSIGK